MPDRIRLRPDGVLTRTQNPAARQQKRPPVNGGHGTRLPDGEQSSGLNPAGAGQTMGIYLRQNFAQTPTPAIARQARPKSVQILISLPPTLSGYS